MYVDKTRRDGETVNIDFPGIGPGDAPFRYADICGEGLTG